MWSQIFCTINFTKDLKEMTIKCNMYLQAECITMSILISWLLKKPADLDLHGFQNRFSMIRVNVYRLTIFG